MLGEDDAPRQFFLTGRQRIGRSSGPNKGFSKTTPHATVGVVTTIPQGLLDQAIERLKAEFQPEQIYLFGSHAWGAPHEDSDVDLMVIVRESAEKAIRRMQRAHRCLRGLRMSKDVFVQTREEFDRCKDLRASLQHQILERGRKLYG
jgi:predicted nucleotidyltransferase